MTNEDAHQRDHVQIGGGDSVSHDKVIHGDEVRGDKVMGDKISVGDVEGVGIAIGAGTSVQIYGDVHYYPIKLRAPLREVFDPLIEDRTRLFGGRDAALTTIADFIRDPSGGYLVVTAPAGFGKTSLMASLVSSTPHAFAYHFFTPLYGDSSLTETFFLCNVVEQMAEWHGHMEQLPDRLNELRALYQQFIDERLERTQVLILDGLDEVTRWKLTPYLSRRLPEKLHIIVTVRDGGQNWLAEHKLPDDQTTHLPLGGLHRDDVAQVLRAGGEGAIALADDPTLLTEVMRVSAYQADEALGADPFYVRLLAEDAAEGRLTPENIAKQPQGLDAYLDVWWQQIKEMAGEKPARDLFGTLTVTLGPIGRAELEAINASLVDDWAEDFFDDVLSQVQRWVVGDEAHGYALAHPRLRDYMRTRIKIGPYLDRLLAYCADWQEYRSSYALAYYAQHLAEAVLGTLEPTQRRIKADKLHRLVHDQAFADAKLSRYPDPTALLNDLRLALDVALADNDLAQAWTHIGHYRNVVRAERMTERSFEEVEAGNGGAALDRASLYGNMPNSQAMMRLWIAWMAASRKDIDLATEAARRAIEHLSPRGVVMEEMEVADPDAEHYFGNALARAIYWLLVRTTWAIAPPRNEQWAWLDDVTGAWPTHVKGNLKEMLSESLDDWAENLGPSIPKEPMAHLLERLEKQMMSSHPTSFREATMIYRDELARGIVYSQNESRWLEHVDRAVTLIAMDDYPSYRELALAWIVAAALVQQREDDAQKALRMILAGALDKPELAYVEDTIAAVIHAFAQQAGYVLNTMDLIQMLCKAPVDETLPAPMQVGGAWGSAGVRHDPWAQEMRRLSTIAAILHRQGETEEAEKLLEQAGTQDPSLSYAGYRTLARLSLACRWIEWGNVHKAREQVKAAWKDAEHMIDKVLAEERQHLVKRMKSWLLECGSAPMSVEDEDARLREIRALSGMERSMYVQYLSAIWSQDAVKLKKLVLLALDDPTATDAVMGRLVGALAAKGLTSNQVARLVRATGMKEVLR